MAKRTPLHGNLLGSIRRKGTKNKPGRVHNEPSTLRAYSGGLGPLRTCFIRVDRDYKPPTFTVREDDPELEDPIKEFLRFLVPERLNDEGLRETPARVAKAFRFYTSGYGQDTASLLRCFKDGGERYDEMVFQRDIPFFSTCEHHLAPFFGVAHIAYIPNGKVVGLSKLSRLLDVYARRLQIQERITTQVADDLQKYLKPKGVGVVLEARHMCMEARGVCKSGTVTVTSAIRGAMRKSSAARAEFLSFVQSGKNKPA